MIIESIELKSHRNCKELHMEFDQGTNILCGDNAQGKANILEAVYVRYTSKLYKSAKDRGITRFNQNGSHIKLQIRKNNVPYCIDMHLKKSKPKSIAINGAPTRRASELFGVTNVVFFSPEDLNIIKDGPLERGRPIDMELCQLNKLYVHSLVQYNEVLPQRNELLRELFFRPEYEETLNVWDMQLVNYGREVVKFRGDFVKQLNEIIHIIHPSFAGGREGTTISYGPYTPQDQTEDVLKGNQAQGIKQKTTLPGPHRNDTSFTIDGIDIRGFGSRRQQYTATLPPKLSELELVKQLSHNDPVLLLDDVLSELDSSRRSHLLSTIKYIQTMITCMGLNDFVNNRFQIDKVFRVVDGIVINEN